MPSVACPARVYKPVLNYLLLDESDASLVRIAAATPDNFTRANAKANEDSFPPIGDVLPTPARDGTLYDASRHANCGFTHVRIGVNARQLAETPAVVADLADDDANPAVVLTIPVAGNRPIRLDARCPDRRAAAVVMPVNFTDCDEDWQPQTRQRAVDSQGEGTPRGCAGCPGTQRLTRRRRFHRALIEVFALDYGGHGDRPKAAAVPAGCHNGEGVPPALHAQRTTTTVPGAKQIGDGLPTSFMSRPRPCVDVCSAAAW